MAFIRPAGASCPVCWNYVEFRVIAAGDVINTHEDTRGRPCPASGQPARIAAA